MCAQSDMIHSDSHASIHTYAYVYLYIDVRFLAIGQSLLGTVYYWSIHDTGI